MRPVVFFAAASRCCLAVQDHKGGALVYLTLVQKELQLKTGVHELGAVLPRVGGPLTGRQDVAKKGERHNGRKGTYLHGALE